MLKCPEFECKIKPSEQEIQEIISSDNFDKYKKFKQNQIVIKNKNLVFCPTIDCETAIDLKK